MPSLGADMEAGTITEWRVAPGDEVRRGDVVAVVDTDKADIEVEVFESGVLEEIVVPAGERVPVGTVLARIRVPGEVPTLALAPTPGPAPAEREPALRPPEPEPAAPAGRVLREPGRIRSSPAARRRAAELGVDLARVTGTGPDGAITAADVERAATAGGPPTPGDRRAEMRRRIGLLMERSKREIPHYYLATEIDLSRLTEWLTRENERRPVTRRLLPAALFVRAVALATREVPEMNGFFQDGAFRPSEAAHVGIAISLRGGGLIAPAVHDVQNRSLDEVMEAMRDLVGRARGGMLRASEMSDPTITVSNLGEGGVRSVYGVIYPPQVALVGFGRIMERPWAEGGSVSARPVVSATLSADHRASDGHRGGIFLAAIDRLLRAPEEL
jgi:pyruvate dehydrogenase E2 component (dihydrolipoamide acetyltransferase)